MKYSLVFVLLLAACGGGGSSGGGTMPSGTPTPTTTYSAKIVFRGALAGQSQIQSELRHIEDTGTATPLPIMVISPMDGQTQQNVYGGVVQVVVSPLPLSTPAVSLADSNPDSALLSTPTPLPSQTPAPLPMGVVAEENVFGGNTPNAQNAGTVTASVGAPVDISSTTAVYAYRAIALACAAPYQPGFAPAWHWNGSGWSTTTDPTQADIYMTGPYCDSPWTTNEANPTLHFPGDGVTVSTDTPFCSLLASQWTNAQTSLDIHTAITSNPDGSVNAELIFKTHDGASIVKLFPNELEQGAGAYYGAIEVAGASVDGF